MEYLVEAIFFIILLITIYNLLKENPFFKKGSLVFSICTSLLCIITMHQFIIPTQQEKILPNILWPCFVLTLEILMLISILQTPQAPTDQPKTPDQQHSDKIRQIK